MLILDFFHHHNDVIMGAIASQITGLTIVYSTVYSDADQRKHQSSVSLAFVRGIYWAPVNSPRKWPVTRKMFPFDDVIMYLFHYGCLHRRLWGRYYISLSTFYVRTETYVLVITFHQHLPSGVIEQLWRLCYRHYKGTIPCLREEQASYFFLCFI